MEKETYTDRVAKREGLSRPPVMETNTVQQINDTKHKCVWVKEERQTHPTLTSYVCTHRRCGRGKLIDEKVDSIDNYV